MRITTRSLLLAAVMLTPVPSRAVVWNVNPQGTGDAATIQAAYDAASAGDLILLAPGTYVDSVVRQMPDYGGFVETVQSTAFAKPGVDLQSSGGPAVTTIDGQGVRHGIVGESVGDVEISGIRFYRAKSSATGGGVGKWGGGILLFRSEPTIQNCYFVECIADGDAGGGGGGIFLGGGGTTGGVIRNNLFLRSTATDLGGGIELFQCTSATVENNTFVDNFTVDNGGAILMNASSVSLNNNIFASNNAGVSGGAVGCIDPTTVTGSCNLFWENDAPIDEQISDCIVAIGQDDNIIGDPLFCNPANDVYTIDAFSPASPQHPSGCGLRGAFPVACGPVSVKASSWGMIKAGYR